MANTLLAWDNAIVDAFQVYNDGSWTYDPSIGNLRRESLQGGDIVITGGGHGMGDVGCGRVIGDTGRLLGTNGGHLGTHVLVNTGKALGQIGNLGP